MRVSEALAARDAVVHHLELACRSVREKTGTIEELRREKEDLERGLEELGGGAVRMGVGDTDISRGGLYNNVGAGEVDGFMIEGKSELESSKREVERLKGAIQDLQAEIEDLKGRMTQRSDVSTIYHDRPPPTYEEGQAGPSMVRFLAVLSCSSGLVLVVLPVLRLLWPLRSTHLCLHLCVSVLFCLLIPGTFVELFNACYAVATIYASLLIAFLFSKNSLTSSLFGSFLLVLCLPLDS